MAIWTNYIFQTGETLEGIQLLEITSSCKYMLETSCKIFTWLWEIPTFVLTGVLVEPDFFGVWAALVWEWPATDAKYWITFLVFSVFPAPDSPLNIRIQHTKSLSDTPKEFRRDQILRVSKWEQTAKEN